MDTQYSTYQLNNLLQLMTTPLGLASLLGLVLIGALVISMRPLKWWVLTVVMYVATFGFMSYVRGDLAFPMNYLRAFGRSICGAGFVVLLIPALSADPQWRRRTVLGGSIAFFILQIIFSLRAGFGGDLERSVFAMITYGLMFTTLIIGVSRWLQTPNDAVSAVRAIALSGAFFILGTLYQYVVDRSQITWSGRLFGTAGNANHAATALGTTLPAICFMLTRPGPKWYRGFIALAAASVVVMLIWTGSRTGLVICIVGVGLLFRFRILTVIVAGTFVAILSAVLLTVFTDAGAMADRLMSMENTRSGTWGMMAGDFLSSPIIGVNISEARASENSYLLIAARTGIIGLIPLAIAMIMIIRSLIQLQQARKYLGDQKLLADLVTGGICSIAVGGMFEGFLFAAYNIALFALFVYFSLLTYLLDYAELQQEIGMLDAPLDEYESSLQLAEAY